MPEYNLTENVMTSLNAQEPWPDNVKLYQPYEVEQILLPDNASCLAVQAFLKMCNLPFEVEMRWNAEFMSPSGRVPFIKCGAFVVSELEPIVQFVANKGVSLCSKLSTEEKAEMRAYMSLITNVLVNAELYISWIDDETFNSVTKIRNSSVYPWPLSWFQTRSKRSSVAKRLKALNWHNKTLDNVLADVEQCCNSLSQRLGDREFFFGTPTPLDALIYGHTRALLSWNGSRAPLLIKPITSALLKHALRMAKLTQMILTPQEDYLMTQAFSLGGRRRSSPERLGVSERTRARRSKMSLGLNRDNVAGEGRDVFGFKPFTSKQVIVMTSKEGYVTCEYENQVKVLTLMDEVSDNAEEPIVSKSSDIKIVNDSLSSVYEKPTVVDSDNLHGNDEAEGSVVSVDSSPTELDALVFGHVFTIITTRLPCRKLAETVRKNESLVALAKRVDERYFKRP